MYKELKNIYIKIQNKKLFKKKYDETIKTCCYCLTNR